MAKTETLGIRLTPQVIGELEQLRDAFAFASYGEVLESMVRLLKSIDQTVCQTKDHPRDWGTSDAKEYLSPHFPDQH